MDVKNQVDSLVTIQPKWYAASAVNGNEVNAVRNLQAKIKAIHYEDLILDAKIIMNKFVERIYFDENDPNHRPPKSMKNTVNITWTVLGNGKYMKQVVKLKNKYPGYIFVRMIMTDESWYAVRNSPRITGLVGSSGSGIKPQPIDNEEVENILKNTPPYNEYAIVVEEQIISPNQEVSSISVPPSTSFSGDNVQNVVEQTASRKQDLKVGNTVTAKVGDEKITGVIVNIDQPSNQVVLKTDMFGRENELTTSLDNVNVDDSNDANE